METFSELLPMETFVRCPACEVKLRFTKLPTLGMRISCASCEHEWIFQRNSSLVKCYCGKVGEKRCKQCVRDKLYRSSCDFYKAEKNGALDVYFEVLENNAQIQRIENLLLSMFEIQEKRFLLIEEKLENMEERITNMIAFLPPVKGHEFTLANQDYHMQKKEN